MIRLASDFRRRNNFQLMSSAMPSAIHRRITPTLPNGKSRERGIF
jgi:hypothetical protein